MKDNVTPVMNMILCVALILLTILVNMTKEDPDRVLQERHLCDGKVYTLTVHQFADREELETACIKAQLREIQNENNNR